MSDSLVEESSDEELSDEELGEELAVKQMVFDIIKKYLKIILKVLV